MLGTQKTNMSTPICTIRKERQALDTRTVPLHPAPRCKDFPRPKTGDAHPSCPCELTAVARGTTANAPRSDPSPALCQAPTPLQTGLAEQPPQPRQGLYQGLKIKPYLSVNTPLLVLAAPFQGSPASPGKHVPIPSSTSLVCSSEDCFCLAGTCAPMASATAASGRGGRAPGRKAAASECIAGSGGRSWKQIHGQAAVRICWKQEWKAGTDIQPPQQTLHSYAELWSK